MNTRTLTAVFDDNASAERASRELAMKVAGVRGAIHSANDGRAGIHQLGIPEEGDGKSRDGKEPEAAERPLSVWRAEQVSRRIGCSTE